MNISFIVIKLYHQDLTLILQGQASQDVAVWYLHLCFM